jgi:hypothetical protein
MPGNTSFATLARQEKRKHKKLLGKIRAQSLSKLKTICARSGRKFRGQHCTISAIHRAAVSKSEERKKNQQLQVLLSKKEIAEAEKQRCQVKNDEEQRLLLYKNLETTKNENSVLLKQNQELQSQVDALIGMISVFHGFYQKAGWCRMNNWAEYPSLPFHHSTFHPSSLASQNFGRNTC